MLKRRKIYRCRQKGQLAKRLSKRQRELSEDRDKTTALKRPKLSDPPEPLKSSVTSKYTETI